MFCLKRSLVKKTTLLNISFLTTCFFFCFFWENVAKKQKKSNSLKGKKEWTKKLCFCHLPNSVKRRVVFFEAKQFLDKRRSKDFLILLVSFLLQLFLLQTSKCSCSTKKTKTICLLKPFFLANEETKRKKNFLFVPETNFLWFLFERKSECWAAVVVGKLPQRSLRESKPFCWVFFEHLPTFFFFYCWCQKSCWLPAKTMVTKTGLF